MSDLKLKDIKELSQDELKNQLFDLKENLLKLRGKAQGARPGEIKRTRKTIARVLTVINLNARAEVANSIQNKKNLPKDMRPKLTRALRRQLSPSEAQAKTLKASKKAAAFPKRKYALKA